MVPGLTVTKLSLLAVDPDLQSARALAEAFSRADFGFRAVPDLRRALAVLRSTPVDVVLAVGNLDTPLVSQLLGTLAHDATLSRLPVVVLSTKGSAEDKRRAMEAGANAYLVKSSFDENEVLTTLRRLLE